ncbi:DMT family transporter [Rickettsiales bacterium LUAb2]
MIINNNLRGIFLALTAFCGYSFMDGAIKYILENNNLSWQFLIFYTGLFVLITLFFVILFGKNQTFKVKAPIALVFRSIAGVTTLNLVFFILPYIPLDLFYSLVFVSPIIASIFAIFFLGEHLNIHKLISIIGGFIGILIITHPWSILSKNNIPLFVIIIPLLCAAGDATIGIIARKYLTKDKPITLVFYQFILTTTAGGTFLLFKQPEVMFPHNVHILPIIITGVFAMMGYLCYIRAVQVAPIQIVLPMGYSQIVFGVLISILIFNHFPESTTILGTSIIILASIYLSLYASFTKSNKNKKKWDKYNFVIKKLLKILRLNKNHTD